MSVKYDFPRLRNESNYQTWAIRTEAFLITQGYITSLDDIQERHRGSPDEPLEDNPMADMVPREPSEARRTSDIKGLAVLKLMVEDGPLSHIKRSKTLGHAWVTLKSLYDKEGFLSLFILIKQFIGMPCKKDQVNTYLSEIRQVIDNLEAKNVILPKSFVTAWVLERLDKSYNDFKSAIYSDFRNNEKAYTLETLSSHILDEYRRRKNSLDNSSSEEEGPSTVLYSNTKKGYSSKPWKKTKGKFCNHCKKPGHSPSECFHLHPHLRRPQQSQGQKAYRVEKQPKSSSSTPSIREKREIREKALIAAVEKLGQFQAQRAPEPENLLDRVSSDDLMNLDLLDLGPDGQKSPLQGDFEEVILHSSSKDIANSLPGLVGRLHESGFFHSQENSNRNSTSNSNDTRFILDNAATSHIIKNRDSFVTYKEIKKTIHWGEASSLNIKGIGSIYIKFKDTHKKRLLNNVLHVPELGVNILSQSKLVNNFTIIMPYNCLIVDIKTSEILTTGHIQNGLYYLDVQILKEKANTILLTSKEGLRSVENKKGNEQTSEPTYVSTQILHQRMGHISLQALKTLAKSQNIILKTNSFNIDQCPECNEAKMISQRHKIPLSNLQSIDYLEKVSSDICGPISPKTWDKFRYFITFLDKRTRFLEVTLLKKKSEALQAFKDFKQKAENQSGKPIKRLHTDNGTEYVNKDFEVVLNKAGIIHEKTAPYTKELNGLIERVNLTLLNKVRSLIYTANLPRYFWGEALLAAAFLYNRTPHSALEGITPFEAKNSRKPVITNIKVFGSLCYYKDNSPKTKLDPRGVKAILIGYGQEANLYKVWDIQKEKALWTRDIRVFENVFLTPSNSLASNTEIKKIKLNKLQNLYKKPQDETTSPSTVEIEIDIGNSIIPEEINQVSSIEENVPDNAIESDTESDPLLNFIEIPLNRGKTPRLTANFRRLYQDESEDELALLALEEVNEYTFITNMHNEPSTYKQAIDGIDRKHWLKAMQSEVQELVDSNTWRLVDLPQGRVALGGRWVYKLKTDSKGNIVRYKARWVVQGFNQILGIDYLETFSTTC